MRQLKLGAPGEDGAGHTRRDGARSIGVSSKTLVRPIGQTRLVFVPYTQCGCNSSVVTGSGKRKPPINPLAALGTLTFVK